MIDATPSGPSGERARTAADAHQEFADFVARMGDKPLSEMSRQHAYYIQLAEAVETGARCLGSAVGAVIVQGDDSLRNSRVVGAGYNGTPSNVDNCDEGGCGRCRTEETRLQGRFYDICVCVHAEQNVIATAARFGVETSSGTLFTTVQPCFTCLKELMQAGITAIYFLDWWPGASHPDYSWVLPQYEALVATFRDHGHEFLRLVLPSGDLVRRDTARAERRGSLSALRAHLNAASATGPGTA